MLRNFAVTTLALLGLLLAAPWLGASRWGQLALSLLWVLVMISVVALSQPRRWERLQALGAGGIIAAVQLIDMGVGHPVAQTTQSLFALWLLVLALRVLFRYLWAADEVGGDEILAAVSLMFLLALLWGALYDALARFEPGAFSGLSVSDSPTAFFQDARSSDLLYFSLVTLTTLGYGDITPVHPLARNLAALEALCGQLYVAVLVARLVTLHLSAQQGGRRPPPASDAAP